MSFGWDADYAIILGLMERYPKADVESIGIEQLHQMIVELPEFEDDPDLATDAILERILWEWYEEANP